MTLFGLRKCKSKDQIRKLIQNGEIRQAIIELQRFDSTRDISNTLIIIRGEYKAYQTHQLQNTLSNEELNRSRNDISSRLLRITDEIKEDTACTFNYVRIAALVSIIGGLIWVGINYWKNLPPPKSPPEEAKYMSITVQLEGDIKDFSEVGDLFLIWGRDTIQKNIDKDGMVYFDSIKITKGTNIGFFYFNNVQYDIKKGKVLENLSIQEHELTHHIFLTKVIKEVEKEQIQTNREQEPKTIDSVEVSFNSYGLIGLHISFSFKNKHYTKKSMVGDESIDFKTPREIEHQIIYVTYKIDTLNDSKWKRFQTGKLIDLPLEFIEYSNNTLP